MVKTLEGVDMLCLMVWPGVVPPVPAFLVSLHMDRDSLPQALADAWGPGIFAALYLGLVATLFAYVIWGRLLRAYPAAMVAPFSLLAPCAGMLASSLILGEIFGPFRLAGPVLILVGVALVVLGPGRRRASAVES
jgi:O-acetylserine/cysteine efflux transporter